MMVLRCLRVDRALPAAMVLALATLGAWPAHAQDGRPVVSLYKPADPLNVTAFSEFYNLNYERAVELFEKVAERHPDDPFAVNHLLTAVLFQELYRMGALNTGEFANNNFVNAPTHAADPRSKEHIKSLVNRALLLEQKRLEADPKDLDALYARGVTRAQYSTYIALIEHAWFSALRNAVGARRDHEKVLEMSPDYLDAKLVVGAHNYVLGSLPWGVKIAASLVGLSGSKDKGIQYLQEVSKGKGEGGDDARAVLILFLRREHRYSEALEMARGLLSKYPHNSLLAIEEANLLRANGDLSGAASAYRRVMEQGHDGRYPGQHYEMAALNLGEQLRYEKDFLGAINAYAQVGEVKNADPDLKQKAGLYAGETYDLMHKRDDALKKYQEVIAVNSSNARAELARERMKEPYRP